MLAQVSCHSKKTTEVKVIESELLQYDEDIVFGNENAQHTVFLFATYKCEFCRLLFRHTIPKLQKSFLANNKVKVVVKFIEFTNDYHARFALRAAVCINKFGKYEKFHKLLVGNHSIVSSDEFYTLIDEIVEKNHEIAQCLYQESNDVFLDRNVKEFRDLGLNGTPVFIINKKIFGGYIPFEALRDILKNEFKLN